MRIRDFEIHRYGPLSPSGRLKLGPFNLFWGENEDGKTLTLEALVKLLFGRTARLFPGLDRVPEEPEGSVVLEDAEGGEVRPDRKAGLPERLGVSPESCRNIFVIRNSDLHIEGESGFYAEVTEKLTGLQKSRIEQMKSSLRDLASLTPQLSLMDTEKSGHLKKRFGRAEALLADLEELQSEAEQSGAAELEEKVVDLREEKERTAERIGLLEKAGRRSELLRLQSHYESWKDLDSRLEEYRSVEEDDFPRWGEAENRLRDLMGDIERAQSELKDVLGRRKAEAAGLAEERGRLEVGQQRRQAAQARIAPLLDDRDRTEIRIEKRKPYRRPVLGGCFFLTAAMLLSLIGMFFEPDAFVPALAASGVLMAAAWLAYALLFLRLSSTIRGLEQRAVAEAVRLGFEAGDADAAAGELARFAQELEGAAHRLGEMEKGLAKLDGERDHCRRDLDKHRDSAREMREIVAELRQRYDLEKASELRETLARKRKLREEAASLETLLRERFPGEQTVHEIGDRIERELQEVAANGPLVSAVEAVEVGEEELERLKARQKRIDEELEGARGDLVGFRDRLRALQEELNDIIRRPDGRILLQSCSDLPEALSALLEWKNRVETTRADAVTAHEILGEIEQDEEKKVARLFG